MKTVCLLFLTMVWAAPGSAVAAATAFDSFGRSGMRQCGSCCYRTSSRLRLSYFHDRGAAEPRVSQDDAEHAAPADDGKHQPVAKPFDERRVPGRASGTHQAPKPVSLTKANGPRQLPNNRQRPRPGNAVRPASSIQAAGAVKGGLIPTQTGHNALPVQTSSVVRPATPSLNNLRHRTPNPAVVGGASNVRSSNVGTINGSGMSRKR